jgi:hypothetical protein
MNRGWNFNGEKMNFSAGVSRNIGWTLTLVLGAAAMAFWATPATRGAIIYTDYPKSTVASYDVYGSGSETFQQSVAGVFVPSANYFFSSATLALFLNGNDVNVNDFDVSLNANADGVPGAAIETFSDVDATVDNTTDLTLNSVLHPTLTAGTSYWLVAIPENRNTQGQWSITSTSTGIYASSSNGGSTWGASTGNLPAFQINGTVVPEPASLSLLVLATFSFSCRRRR